MGSNRSDQAAAERGTPRAGDRAAAGTPPPADNMGVEFRVDWLTLTIAAPVDWCVEQVQELLGVQGVFEEAGHGAQGYKRMMLGPGGIVVLGDPVTVDDTWGTRATVRLPGRACAAFGVGGLRSLAQRVGERRHQVARLDLAFDHQLFSSATFFEAIRSGEVRTLAKRETFRQLRDLNDQGTVYVGGRTSARMLRVYDKPELGEGVCRVELETKNDRAQAIWQDLLAHEDDQWANRGLAHLRDYVDVERAWWHQLVATVERAGLVLAKRIDLGYRQAREWVLKQVAPMLAVIVAANSGDLGELESIVKAGMPRLKARHRALIAEALN